jgi:hypothetical protein
MWNAPKDDGGCPITGYAVFRNDGEGGLPTIEVNTDQDSNIRDKPTLRSVTVSNFPEGSLSSTFMYQVEAFNAVLSTKSASVSFKHAAVPSMPQSSPVDDISVTSDT